MNAAILEGILEGHVVGPKRDMAVLNAAAGFVVTETHTHDEFGKPEPGEIWRLRLTSAL
jgi:anthranilate phosphoribosyltransferase